MSAANKSRAKEAAELSSEKRLHELIQTVIRLGKAAGAEETEVHLDETLDALTRFANNGIHQNVAEHGLTVSVRTVLDGKTSRVSTNKLDQDSLRAAVESSLSLAASQPKTPHLLPMPGKQRYAGVQRFVKATAELSAAERAREVRKACDLAVNTGQVAAGIFVSGQMQSAVGNSRGLFASHRQTRSEFSITMQQEAATSWAKGNAADVRNLDPLELAQTASKKAKLATQRNRTTSRQIHGDPRTGCGARFGGIPFLRFFRDCPGRQAFLPERPDGQAAFRQKHFCLG